MSGRQFLVIAGITMSAILLTVFLIATAPAINCFIGLILYDKWNIIRYDSEVILVYNWILGIIAFLMTISTIIMLKYKKLKLYARLLIPYILSLIIVILYAGSNIDYIGDGFVEIGKKPFSSEIIYKNKNGKPIIESYEWLRKEFHNYRIVFVNIEKNKIYNEEGYCILRKPYDDEQNSSIRIYDDYYYTSKSIHNYTCERFRFFDMEGNYVITQEYKGAFHANDEFDSGELINEYLEEVDEKPDGVKVFKTK